MESYEILKPAAAFVNWIFSRLMPGDADESLAKGMRTTLERIKAAAEAE